MISDGIKRLSIYKYSLTDWSKILPEVKIKVAPELKTAADIISGYEDVKIRDLKWI